MPYENIATQKQVELLRLLIGKWEKGSRGEGDGGARELYENGTLTLVPNELITLFFEESGPLIADMLLGALAGGVNAVAAATGLISMLVAHFFYNLGMMDASIDVKVALGGIKLDANSDREDQ